MNPVSAVVVFIVIWWLVLFITLPFGVRRVEAPEEGHDAGAPQQPMMWRKVGVTTAVTIVLWAVVFLIVELELIGLSDLAIEL